MLGASTRQWRQYHRVIVAGVAGLIADALSMGSSGYLAAQSEREVYAHEIAMERDEIALMPEIERDELALIYEAKGMDRDSALPHRDAGDGRPGADARRAGAGGARHRRVDDVAVARGVDHRTRDGDRRAHSGASLLLLRRARPRSSSSFAIAMLSHWLVGAARSVFTGRGVFRSGIDMFVVGLGVAVVGYFVGEWIGRLL